MTDSEIYIEMQRIGNVMKVIAIDSKTGIEVLIQGPANENPTHLKKVAIDKLRYRLEKL